MSEVRRRASELAGPTWILAKRQTAATGRRGRAWTEPTGNFAATLFLPLRNTSPAEASLRSFVVSRALFEALDGAVPQSLLALKWPNDVLLSGGKVAGILLESSSQGQYVDWLSIGVGVNLMHAPDAEQVEARAFRPVCVADHSDTVPTPEAFLERLAMRIATHEKLFQEFGFDPIRRLWLSKAARLGEVITARLPKAEHTGTFEDVDAEGNLVLTTAQGRISIPAADVYF